MTTMMVDMPTAAGRLFTAAAHFQEELDGLELGLDGEQVEEQALAMWAVQEGFDDEDRLVAAAARWRALAASLGDSAAEADPEEGTRLSAAAGHAYEAHRVIVGFLDVHGPQQPLPGT